MNQSAKLPEIRKEAFTKARESLGLSTKELSGMACLSVRQIEQIENGESSTFYGPQVKVTAAKKVAGLLKLKEEDAFDFGGVQPPAKIIAEKEPEPVVAKKVAKAEKATDPEKKSKPQQVEETPKVVIKDPEPLTQLEGSKASVQSNPKKKLFVLLCIAAALIFSIVNLRPLFFPEPPKEEIVVEVVQEAPPAAPVEEAKPAAPPAAVAPQAVAPAAAVSTECPAADAVIASYKPEAPKKAADLVYAQSKTAQTICVIDASGKTQTKTLESGIGASIYGKPPFKVLTLGLNQVDLYFQGAKVRTSNAGKTIILEAAEISQPAAITDSQLR
ncbi:helix-turn-helix transcriptional regulator [Polynucleobacter sp. MWH-Berg-3C6]|uniref:helix-turn-helix domain-containing protein n=1 Tax=Polynucleobacter sp. MWH-Berg-3C6 TaxID=1855882 RepID=UPI001C0AE446|nr:helix-turn-helix transcriptional regulator [Polynucleobacter sp. MWH-Berg-3C6]